MAYFSHLKLDVLQDHASRWAHTFPKVTRISLHQYHRQQEPPARYRYAIIFELEPGTDTQENQEDGSPKVSSEEASDIIFYDYFYRDEFKMVYNYENIDPFYQDEWFFFPKYSNEEWPVFAPKEPSWQLFPIEHLANIKSRDKGEGKLQKSSANLKRTETQKDKMKARGIADKYISECQSKGKIPHIYEAKKLIKDKLSRDYKSKHTIHDWIKDLFPEESRKIGQGRPPKT